MQKILLIVSIFIVSQLVFSQNSELLKHTVADGESLYGISKKYNTSVANLIELNPQVDEGIKPGMVLSVPGSVKAELKTKETLEPTKELSTQQPPAVENHKIENQKNEPSEESPKTRETVEYYVVKEGDTYYSLSRKYATTVSALMALNNNAPLKIGEKLIVGKKTEEASEVENQKKITEAVVFEEVEHKEPVDAQQEKQKETPKEEPKKEVAVKEEPKMEVSPPVEQKKPVENYEVKVEKYTDKTVVKAADHKIPAVEPVAYTNTVKRILIIPFDPYLYFSDADMEIAKQSKMEHTKIRQAFRRRLNALMEPQGYETIHLLGGRIKDSLTDLNKIYKSVTYNYQDALYNPEAQVQRIQTVDGQLKEADKTHVEKVSNDPLGNSRASLAKDESKYYGVKVADPNFFPYFNNKYKIDYYIFVNQFEVKTNYQTCLDRTTKNYERSFITHFSIFDNSGKQIAGNRIKINYESNENRIQKILTDNMQRVADQIIGELPAQK